jgi:uncharacterized membrane protein
MVVLAALIHLPLPAVATIGIVMIVGHNALDGVRVTSWAGPGTPVPGFWASMWHVLHVPGIVFPLGADGPKFLVLYPLIPWIGVMAVGYAVGAVYRKDELSRRHFLVRAGIATTIAFFIVRGLNVYGDPSPWAHQTTMAKTIMSFFAVSKYPPSLSFLLMTLGPGLIFLGLADGKGRNAIARFFIVYGRVPFFYYVLQWITAKTLTLIAFIAAGKPTDYLFSNLAFSPPPPPGTGFGLGTVYALWILGFLLLYPLCKWFAGVKSRRRDWWLSYI